MSTRRAVNLTMGSSEWDALRQRAARESRPLANLILVLIRNGMAPPQEAS